MVTFFHKTYVALVLAIVLLTGLVGWTMKVQMAPPLHNSASIHAVADGPNIPCPPPPFNCTGG
jgi:hypothetical protein